MQRSAPAAANAITLLAAVFGSIAMSTAEVHAAAPIRLPAPQTGGRIAVADALKSRRSVREFDRTPLPAQALSQLLWAAQGITTNDGRRTAPSAGALYPLEIYIVAANVAGLAPGAYRYIPSAHRIEQVNSGDRRAALARAALGQDSVANAPAVIVIAAVYARTAGKYGGRAERYVHIEAGCAAENIALQAVAMALGSVVVGAFDDSAVRTAVPLGTGESPLILMPVGHPARR